MLKDEVKRSSQKERKRSNAGRVCGPGCARHDRAVFVRITRHRHSFHTQPNIFSSLQWPNPPQNTPSSPTKTRETPSSGPPIAPPTTPTRPMPRTRTRALQQGQIREPGEGSGTIPPPVDRALRKRRPRCGKPDSELFVCENSCRAHTDDPSGLTLSCFLLPPRPVSYRLTARCQPTRNRSDPSTPAPIHLHACCLTL